MSCRNVLSWGYRHRRSSWVRTRELLSSWKLSTHHIEPRVVFWWCIRCSLTILHAEYVFAGQWHLHVPSLPRYCDVAVMSSTKQGLLTVSFTRTRFLFKCCAWVCFIGFTQTVKFNEFVGDFWSAPYSDYCSVLIYRNDLLQGFCAVQRAWNFSPKAIWDNWTILMCSFSLAGHTCEGFATVTPLLCPRGMYRSFSDDIVCVGCPKGRWSSQRGLADICALAPPFV